MSRRVNLSLPDDVYAHLEEGAEILGVTKSALGSELLRMQLPAVLEILRLADSLRGETDGSVVRRRLRGLSGDLISAELRGLLADG